MNQAPKLRLPLGSLACSRAPFVLILMLAVVPLSSPNIAQAQEQTTTYVSQVDEDLTLRRVSVLPVTDNVDGIYARPAEAQLVQLVKDSHQWDFVDAGIAGHSPSLVELEEDPKLTKQTSSNIDADGLLGAAISKGPGGISIRLDLFLRKDGRLIAQDMVRDLNRFELSEIKDQVKRLYKRLLNKIPYDGLVLSRQGNRVTVNLGKSDGVTKDQTLTAIQFISVNRHPKFGFIVSSDKEVLGQIKILKVDETLSFGAITSEKERGVIRRFAKISGLNHVDYGDPGNLENRGGGDVSDRPDANTSFGKNPREWLPIRPPSFGAVGANLGVGQYTSNVALASGPNFEAHDRLYPSLNLFAELWITPEWTVRADVTQGILSSSNPRSGSTPSQLNESLSRYSLEGRYNFLLRDDFFGPKIGISAGFMAYRMYVDNSTPTAFTTTNYSGFYLGLSGSVPVTDDKLWYVGGRLNLFLFPSLSESPVSSGGSSKNTINDFSLFGERKIAENIRLTAAINFSLLSTNFSGQGNRTDGSGTPESATSLSQKQSVLEAGLVYMF